MTLILASKSPRRRELLSEITTDFICVLPGVEEITCVDPTETAVKNAVLKGRAVSGEAVLSCDTVVACGGKIYGKPMDEKAAEEMLRSLSGKTHEVISGVYLRIGNEEKTFSEKSFVTMKTLCEKEIADYIKSGSPFDKAGGYGIQDGVVVENYTGDYNNIVGLPLERLKELWRGI